MQVKPFGGPVLPRLRRYDVCLSFAGEDRPYVQRVAETLARSGISFFYDNYEAVDLWGKDLYQHLSLVYRDGRFCVVFISQFYAAKLWTKLELNNAQARAFEDNREYILPARFDDTQIPGVLPTIGYVDLRMLDPGVFAEMIIAKVKGDSEPPIQLRPKQGHSREKRFQFAAGLIAPRLPLTIVLWLQWLVAVFLMFADSRDYGMFAVLAPVVAIALAFAVSRLITSDYFAAWVVSTTIGAVIGGGVGDLIHDGFVRYGLVIGGFFSGFVTLITIERDRRISLIAAAAMTMCLAGGLGLFEAYRNARELLLPARAYLLTAMAAVESLFVVAGVQIGTRIWANKKDSS